MLALVALRFAGFVGRWALCEVKHGRPQDNDRIQEKVRVLWVTTISLYSIDHSTHLPPRNEQGPSELSCYAGSPATFFQSENSEKVEEMTSRLGKLSLAVAAAGGFSFMALSPTSIEAGAIHQNQSLAAPTVNSDVVQVVCERSLSNLWSCNDDVGLRDRSDVQVQDRRVAQNQEGYTHHPCDHSYEIARNGSRCGNRAADKRPGGR